MVRRSGGNSVSNLAFLIRGVELNLPPPIKSTDHAQNVKVHWARFDRSHGLTRWTTARKEVNRMKTSNVGSKLPVAMTKAN